MGELACGVIEELVTRREFVACAGSLGISLYLQLGELLYRDRHLEKEHSTANVLANIEGASNGRVDGHVLNAARAWRREVGGEVVEELTDEIVGVCQVHEQIVRLRQQVVRKVGHHEHLGLL